MRSLLVPLIAFFGGCADETYLIVTVDKRPAVHAATKLKITLSNSGSMRTDDLDLAGNEFPVTFSLTAPGRAGELGISVDALDANDALVGRGAGQASLTESSASVTLDSADFVVNTEVANNQFLSSDFEANGLQLASIPNGTWMVTYREDCTMCDIFGRRFDASGLPVTSTLSASTNAFKVNTRLTSSTAVPSIASSGNTTLVFWDFFESGASTQGVACRVINDMGGASPTQTTIASESADVVTAAPLPNGNFAVTWQQFQSAAPAMEVIRAVIVKPDCTLPIAAAPATISIATISTGHRRSHVASAGSTIVFTWVSDDSAKIRTSALVGNMFSPELVVVGKTTQFVVEHVRIVPWGTGFALGVRWAAATGGQQEPGKIEIYRLSAAGAVQGMPILVTDKSRTDFLSREAFGLARGTDDSLMIAWHVCETGAGSCEVYGRRIAVDGTPQGEAFVIPTSTGSDQVSPSVAALPDGAYVAAWNDSSALDPDRSGSSVRARILYPPP